MGSFVPPYVRAYNDRNCEAHEDDAAEIVDTFQLLEESSIIFL